MEAEVVGLLSVAIIVYIIIYAILIALSIAAYVLNSLGMYTIAKRRNISKPILAWIPVANVWILGAIADHYDETVNGVKKKSRAILLGLNIVVLIVSFLIMLISVIVNVMAVYESYSETMLIVFVIAAVVLSIIIIAITIALAVFQYIAYYKLFKSCQPDNAVVFLVLSIFVSMALPVIIFIIRKNDKGLVTDETVMA